MMLHFQDPAKLKTKKVVSGCLKFYLLFVIIECMFLGSSWFFDFVDW